MRMEAKGILPHRIHGFLYTLCSRNPKKHRIMILSASGIDTNDHNSVLLFHLHNFKFSHPFCFPEQVLQSPVTAADGNSGIDDSAA